MVMKICTRCRVRLIPCRRIEGDVGSLFLRVICTKQQSVSCRYTEDHDINFCLDGDLKSHARLFKTLLTERGITVTP